MDTNELLAIAQEMRKHKVNHGKQTSPTLIAWAERVEKAAKLPERIVLWSPQPQPLGPDWYFAAERTTRPDVNGMPVYRTLDAVEPAKGPDPRIEEALQYLHPFRADVSDSRSPPDWAANIARILTQPRT